MIYLNAAEQYMDLRHQDITHITCVVLILEPFLFYVTVIIIDGMTNISSFTRHKHQRDWTSHKNNNADVTVLVLDKPPRGSYHIRQLALQLGYRFLE